MGEKRLKRRSKSVCTYMQYRNGRSISQSVSHASSARNRGKPHRSAHMRSKGIATEQARRAASFVRAKDIRTDLVGYLCWEGYGEREAVGRYVSIGMYMHMHMHMPTCAHVTCYVGRTLSVY